MINEECAKSIVSQAGGSYVGIQSTLPGQSDLILFNDPETGTTVAVRSNIATVQSIKAKLLRSRMAFHRALLPKQRVVGNIASEVKAIRDIGQTLLAHICLDTQAIEKLMHMLSRLDVLKRYMDTREI